jgi:hypothetical protein
LTPGFAVPRSSGLTRNATRRALMENRFMQEDFGLPKWHYTTFGARIGVEFRPRLPNGNFQRGIENAIRV